MTFEVEQKYRVADLSAIGRQLDELAAQWEEAVQQRDTYYSHPSRDFTVTDEALRIRCVENQNCITYKGPKLDTTTKTRLEIEIPIAPAEAAAEGCGRLFVALGFRPVAEVCKHRRLARVPWDGRQVEVALDQVENVGTFVELELIAEEQELDAARTVLASLSGRLGLTEVERRSYLELLLEAAGGGRDVP